MNEAEAVYAECRKHLTESGEISHGCARTIAAWWNDGAHTPNYAFVSTGTITRGLSATDFASITGRQAASKDDVMALNALDAYVRARVRKGERGAVSGWVDMWVQ